MRLSKNQDTAAWKRRDFIGAASLLALALGVPVATISVSHLDPAEAPDARQITLFRDVAELVIPRSETPGAGDVGAGEFVLLALAHGLEKSREPWPQEGMAAGLASFVRADGSLRMADWLQQALDRRANGDFLRRDVTERTRILTAHDAEAFAEGAPPSPWKVIKGLVLTGYYTSEAGGSHELRYELVPGRYDPKLPLRPGDAAFSSDWSAVDFG